MRMLDEIEKEFLKKKLPKFNVGDIVDVYIKISEADKDRMQVFSGVVIARKGGGLSETFTVRRIVQGEGVERIFPLHSPRIAKVVVKKSGKVRRAKLYYLRERVGKATRIAEKIGGEKELVGEKESVPVVEKPVEQKKDESIPQG
jgi:large subunit ribosomal protein L19